MRHNCLVLQSARLIDRRTREVVSAQARCGPQPHHAAFMSDNTNAMLKRTVLDLLTYCDYAAPTRERVAHASQSGDLLSSKRDPRTWYIGGKDDRHVATSSVSVTDVLVSRRSFDPRRGTKCNKAFDHLLVTSLVSIQDSME